MSSQSLSALLPVFFALTAALFFSLALLQQNIGLRQGVSPRDGTMISMVTSAAIFWLLAPFYVEAWYWWHSAILIFAAGGLIRPFLSANFAMAGLKHLGPTMNSTLTSTSPLFGAMIGVVMFGEIMTLEVFIATIAIVAGVIILARGRDTTSMATSWPIWALALPIGAALIRSFSHGLIKFGMIGIPSPMFAALIGLTVSSLIAIGTRNVGRGGEKMAFSWQDHKWFVIAGVFNVVALYSLNTGLFMGDIIIVVPIIGATPIFTLFLSRFIFRQETLDARKLLVVTMVVPAIILLAASRL